jgi:hypothetical protein
VSPLEFAGRYPREWAQVAVEVKEAAGWRCIRCQHPDSPQRCRELSVARGWQPCDERCRHSRREERRRVLTVHHLDGDKGNGAWWNLLALCQVCHLQVQAKVDPARTYLWHHKRWLRPYVAGYYAHAVLGEELGRQEVEERLGELLRAGQPHLDDPMDEPT